MKVKVDEYNQFYGSVTKCQISSREVNGRHVLEGIIKVYWGTEASVRLKEYDDTRLIRNRKAMSLAPDMFINTPAADSVEGPGDVVDDVVKDESEAEDEPDSTLPYFNPRTHPLFRDSLQELNKPSSTDPFFEKLLDHELLEDVTNDNLLSYDPIQKWKTLNNLVNNSDSDNSSTLENSEAENDNNKTETTTTTTVTSNDKLQRSKSVQSRDPNKNIILRSEVKSSTLPSSLRSVKDDLDDLLQVERTFEDHERVYHTVNGQLPVDEDDSTEVNHDDISNSNIDQLPVDEVDNPIVKQDDIKNSNVEVESLNESSNKKFTVEKVAEASDEPVMRRSEGRVKSRGPRQLRRRHGKKMDKNKLRRRSSINGHWYDRDTSVFTPPKHTPMSVHTSSKMSSGEVVTTLLEKYKIESEPGDYALYVVKETGETRMLGPAESPLVLRVNLGPREEISKIYLMDKHNTSEISHNVAQYLNFSYAELRSFLNMFYEEEEREADRIRTKFLIIKRRLEHVIRNRKGQGQVLARDTPERDETLQMIQQQQ